MANTQAYVGCSGWHYAGWIGDFYPADLKLDKALPYYAEHFATAELNTTFYHLPKPEAVRGWFARTPDNFIFAWKASRYLTHLKRLKGDLRESIDLMLDRYDLLGHKGGPIFFQLPPSFKFDLERLEGFMEQLPTGYRYAFEFRHATWWRPETYAALERHRCGFVMSDIASGASPAAVVGDFAYLRLHGITGQYWGRYPANFMLDLARSFREDCLRNGRDVFIYFDNDHGCAAPKDAHRMAGLLNKWLHT